MVFKERLMQKRVDAGMTQEQLDQSAGVTARTITDYELGTRKPSHMEVVTMIAE